MHAEHVRELAKAIASEACAKDPRHCKLRNLKAMYLGCGVNEIICDLGGVADPAIDAKLNEHRSCRDA